MTSRAIVEIRTDADREKVARWAQQTNLGTVVEFRKKSRSTEQNAKLWAMLGEVSEQVDWYGNKLSPADWKTIFSASLRKSRIVPGLDIGTVVPLGLSTSAMTVDEMGDLIEIIHAFGAERGVTFKDTDTGSTAPRDPVDDDAAAPGASSEPGETPPPVSPGNNSPDGRNWSKQEQHHLMDYARKALNELDTQTSEGHKRDFVDNMRGQYLAAVESDDAISIINAMDKPLEAVLSGKRTVEQARNYIARDLIGCDISKIGG